MNNKTTFKLTNTLPSSEIERLLEREAHLDHIIEKVNDVSSTFYHNQFPFNHLRRLIKQGDVTKIEAELLEWEQQELTVKGQVEYLIDLVENEPKFKPSSILPNSKNITSLT